MALPVAIQLFTVNGDLGEDLDGTFRRLKEMGYDGVEFAGFCGLSPEGLKAKCEEFGLTPVAFHMGIYSMRELGGAKVAVETFHKVGCKYIVIPMFTSERYPGGELWEDSRDFIIELAKEAAVYGMKVCYHNHELEFVNFYEGKYIFDTIFEMIPGEYLNTEIDTCWARIGGVDPAEYLRKYAGRTPVVHIKDFYITEPRPEVYSTLFNYEDEETKKLREEKFEFRPAGHGLLDMPEVIKASIESGAEWLIVEQDRPSAGMTPMECAEKSVKFIKSCQE